MLPGKAEDISNSPTSLDIGFKIFFFFLII